MEARIRLEKNKTEKGIEIKVVLTYVPVDGEVAKLAESLGYKKMAFDTFWGIATTAQELDTIRKPMVDLMAKGLIIDGTNVKIG